MLAIGHLLQEQQAELRHAAFQPVLAAAAAAVQSWLAAQGNATLGEALAANRSTGTAAEHRSQHALAFSSPDVPQPRQPPVACADGASRQCSPAVSDIQGATEDDVDYIPLAALKGALRPKLRFVDGGGSRSSGLRQRVHECSASILCLGGHHRTLS